MADPYVADKLAIRDVLSRYCRGRYLDRWQKRADSWQIVAREHILDTQSTNGIPNADAVNQQSRRDTADPSFKLFAKP